MIGKTVTFELNIPMVGHKTGAGIVTHKGLFPILGETWTVTSDGSGDFPAGTEVEVKRSSMRTIV